LVVYFCRDILARVFTSQEELIPLIKDAYTVDILILLAHGFAMIQAGAVRGLGKLSMATGMVFFAFYVVSLPGAYFFAFTMEMGMVGLWWGVVVGSISEVILYFFFLRFWCDWKNLAIEISQRMQNSRHISPNVSIKKYDLMEPLVDHDYQLTIKEK
jgi:MATE family multidrug resistance protein